MKGTLLDRFDTVNEWVGRILSYLILIIIGVVLFEVTLRYVFNSPTVWVHEMSGLLLMSYIMLGGGYTLLHRSHIKIDIFYERLSPKTRLILDLTIASLLFFCFTGVLLWKGGILAFQSVMIREISPSGVWTGPLYPFKLLIPVGALLIMVQWVVMLIRDFRQVRVGNRTP